MKLSIGQKVRVREDMEVGEPKGFVPYMKEFMGKTVTITSVQKGEDGLYYYNIKEDNEGWYWSLHMFEGDIQLTIE